MQSIHWPSSFFNNSYINYVLLNISPTKVAKDNNTQGFTGCEGNWENVSKEKFKKEHDSNSMSVDITFKFWKNVFESKVRSWKWFSQSGIEKEKTE